jgi:hypothetical protein
MPSILASAVIGRAQTILQDTTAVRWSQTELLGWLNAGQREVVMVRPDACTKIANVTCVAGTKQAIPSADGIMLIDVIRNMGASGTTPGKSIRKVPREILDAQTPGWHSMTATAEVLHYTFEPRAPKNFYVYPPSTGSVSVEILYSASPTDVAVVSNVLGVDDIYEEALVDYILYRAYSKDSEYAGNAERAKAHRAAFENTIGLKTQADTANVKNPNVPG